MTTADEVLPGLYRSVFDNSPVALSLLDVRGHQIAANRAFTDLMGLEPGSLVGPAVEVITRDADRIWTSNYLARLVTLEIDEYTTEKSYRRGDGSEVRCRLTARPIVIGGEVAAVVGVIEPVDERPVVSDARMRKMIENIDDTVSLIDADGNLLDTSGRYRTTLGYPKEFWATRTVFDLLHPDDAVRVLSMREEVLTSPGMHVVDEFQVRSASGEYEDIEVHAVNMLEDPDVGGIVITSRNITTRKAMLDEVAARRDEAIAQAELRMRLIATVSHELRNPLHAMSGLSELLATSDLPDESTGLASTLHRQILGLTRVIDDLLETTRFDIGVIELHPEPMVLRGLIDDVVMLGRSLAEGRAVEVSASVSTTVPTAVHADTARLRQVLGNLVGNAVKFTDSGHVQVRVHNEGAQVVFEIVDTGRGIPPEELDSVFQAFSTASTGGTRVGAGLGLSIVTQIVELMGGTTTVTSRVGYGSTFVVRLPLTEADLPAGVAEATEVVTVQVLVVEDNPVNQMLAKNQLERLGMSPVIVGSGEEAITLLERGEGPYVILMDHQLPGMDGLECTRLIRELERDGRRRAVIVGVTASAMAADRDACLIGGMDDFLAKPVSLADLGATLQRWAAPTDAAPDTGTEIESDTTSDAVEEHIADAGTDVTPELHVATLDRLADELGGYEIVAMLVTTYLDELTGRVEALNDALVADELVTASRAAHTLKSSSRLLGGPEIGDLCQAIEHAATLDEARVVAAEALPRITRFGAELNAWKATAT